MAPPRYMFLKKRFYETIRLRILFLRFFNHGCGYSRGVQRRIWEVVGSLQGFALWLASEVRVFWRRAPAHPSTRALARKPAVLVLDGRQAPDAESERSIKDTLASLRGEVTVLIIAHRLTTVLMPTKSLRLKTEKWLKRKPRRTPKIRLYLSRPPRRLRL